MPLVAGKLAHPLSAQTDRGEMTKKMGMHEGAVEYEIIWRIKEIAMKKGWPMVQVAIAWSMSKVTSPIIGIKLVSTHPASYPMHLMRTLPSSSASSKPLLETRHCPKRKAHGSHTPYQRPWPHRRMPSHTDMLPPVPMCTHVNAFSVLGGAGRQLGCGQGRWGGSRKWAMLDERTGMVRVRIFKPPHRPG